MADAILRIKTVMDIGDAASNISALQRGLSKLKLPDKLSSNLNKNISEFYKEYDKYQRKISEGIKTQSDQSQAEKSLNRMKALYSSISKELNQVTKLNIDDIIDLDSGEFKHIADEISRTVKEINKIKVDKKPFEDAKTQIESLTKSKKITGDDGILNRMLGHINKGEITEAKSALDELKKYAEKAAPRQVYSEKAKGMVAAPGTMGTEKYSALQKAIAAIEAEFGKADAKAAPLIQRLNELQKELAETKAAAGKDIINGANDFNRTVKEVDKVTDSLRKMHQEEYSFKRQTQDIDRQIQSYFGLAQMIRKVGDIARAAFNTVKELDAAMVETAVVTNFDVSDMWAMLPEYTAQANQLGSTIKDVYEAATLYFQQGLNKQQSLGLANETLKMARIGGLQAAEATNMMTAALRGFNMEINGTSAQRINDVYSELAAITAADTKEIGSAMERTASIANSANMEFETTSAFLSQMIETTREAPENLGTAMKTIIARFQEMKQDPTKLVDSEGVAMDANKIDTALKTIGVDLTNQKGEFRDLDDVFLDISAKWDSLTQGQQRYIATIAAGSRQQSRFIAMMQNHERVMELVEAANNSAGASQKQFEKTLDSMASKLNRLKNAWNQFTMGLMNDKLIKGGIDALTKSFTVINKIIDFLGKIPPKPFEGITKSALTLATTLGMLNIGKKMTRGGVMGVVGWWKKEGGFMENFKEGYGMGEATGAAKRAGEAFGKTFQESSSSIIGSTFKGIKAGWQDYQQTMMGTYGKYSAGFLSTNWGQTGLESNLRDAFKSASEGVDFQKLGHKDADAYMDSFIKRMQKPQKIKNGEAKGEPKYKRMRFKNIADSIRAETGVDISSQIVPNDPGNLIDKQGTKLAKFANAATNAGNAIQYFGMLLQNTPLAPFGTAISAVGMGISAFSTNMVTFTTVMSKGTLSLKTFGKALWTSFGPIAVVMASLLALIGVMKLVDKLVVTDKERLEMAKDAAASASEAFDMAKQETSELNDALSRVEENQKAFETLAVGTAEFNDQLVNSNELISQLLKQYPMLNDKRFLSTDENGVMHLSKEGIKAVKDYQKEIQTHASAISLIQSADFSSEEKTQKAEQLRKDANDRKLTEKQKQNKLDEADLLDKQAETEKALARVNALRTSLNNKEIQNVEALSAAYADLYDKKRTAAEAEVEKMSKKEQLQTYADFHNYTYDASTKKMTNAQGTEVEYDKTAVKDEVIEQTVLLEFEEDAKTLDGILSNLDTRFSETLEKTYEGSDRVISNLLGSNIETDTDLIEDILSDTSGLQKAVNSLKKEEIAAILGVTTDEVSGDIDAYKAQTVNLLTEKASNIAKAQYESYAKLSEMMARAQQGSLTDASLEGNKNLIRDQIRKLTTQQATTLSTIGQTLQSQAGDEAMAAFVDEASFIYLNRSKQVAQEFDDIIDGVNWESPTSRLEAYNKMLNSTDENIQKVGKSMLSTAGEANIVGAAFDEFLGGDWLDLQENADDLKNSLGEIDGLGILKAAESSKTLKTLLDTGRVSAGGLAMALQAVDSGSISQASSAVLELLSAMTKATDVALEAHNIIENFDPGIDFGEGEDFMIENAEKAAEYMENQEWGNQQLQNYIKLAAGVDTWNATLLKYNGDVEATTKELSGIVTQFKDGLNPAYDKLMSGKGLNGKKISENLENAVKAGRIDEELKAKLEKVRLWWDENGDLQFEFPEDLTTEELETFYKEAGGISTEYAKLFIQDIANYTDTELSRLQANDLEAHLKDPDFQKSFMTEDGKLAIDNASLQTLESILGKENFELLAKELGFKDTEKKTAGQQLKDNSFKVVDENGERLKGGKELAESYAKKYYEKETTGANGKTDLAKLSDIKSLQTDMKFDFAKFIADNNAKHMDEQQAQENAWAAYQAMQKSGQPMLYNGMEVSGDLKTATELAEEFKALDEKQKWYDIGTAIAEGMMGYIKGLFPDLFPESENLNMSPESQQKSKTTSSEQTYSNEERRKELARAETINKVNEKYDNVIKKAPQNIDTKTEQNSLALIKQIAGKNQTLTPEIEKAFQSLKIDTKKAMEAGLIKKSDDKTIAEIKQAVKEGKTESANQSDKADRSDKDTSSKETDKAREKAVKQLGDVAEGLKTLLKPKPSEESSGPSSGGGAHGINIESKKRYIHEKHSDNVSGIPKEQETVVKVKTKETGLKETKDKIDKIGKATSKTQTIKVGAKTNKSTASALDGIKKIREAAKKKSTVNVDAKVKGKDDTNNLSSVIKNVKAKAVKVAAKVSGSSKVSSLRNEISKLHDKSITITTYKKTESKSKGSDGNTSAKGQNNYISHRSAPSFGSMAKGVRYGRLGPKGKGGLTLTGEKGFEIAWIPSESRSMVLGTEGPQMLNLPSDAVVYTHEQSKKIVKQKSIPAGSHSGRNRGSGGSTTPPKKPSKKPKAHKSRPRTSDKGKKQTREIIEYGKITSWVFNMEQKIAQVKRKQEEAQKRLNKQLEIASNTLADVTKNGNEDIKRLKQSITLNKQLANYYTKQLKKLDKKGKTTITWTNPTEERTKKKKKWGKWKKGSDKKHKTSINLGSYIKFDPATGAYVVDYNKINKNIGLDHKNKKGKVIKGDKNKAKAVKEAAEKAISENTSKRDSALDARSEAEDKLEELGKQLADTFYNWENELTRIYYLSKKIEAQGKKTERYKGVLDLQESMISSGLESGFKNSIKFFKKQLSSMVQEINFRARAIQQQIKDIKKLQSGTEAGEELKAIKIKLRGDANYTKKKKAADAASKKVTADTKAINAEKAAAKKSTRQALLEKQKAAAQKKANAAQKKIDKANKVINSKKSSRKEKKKARKELEAAKKERSSAKNSIKALNNKIKKEKKTNKKLSTNQKISREGNLAKKEANAIKNLQKKRNVQQKKINKANKILKDKKSSKKEKKQAKKDLKAAKKEKAKLNQQIKNADKIRKAANKKKNTLQAGKKARKNIAQDKKNARKAKDIAKKAEKNNISSTRRLALEAREKELKEQRKILTASQKYVTAKRNGDGTLNISLDYTQLEKDRKDGKISQKLYEQIKKYYDNLNEQNDKLNDLYLEQLKALSEVYDMVGDLKEQYADRSEELVDAAEEAQEKEIDKIEKLSDALEKALKNLLDEVKNKLEERRRVEDNAKTEQEISKKQQRLAALRADTSGGHQVEIAQLEKEIKEDQQSYQRSLEDQLLDRLQYQADKAAEQRERQINLLNQQLEIAKANGTNVALVNKYLKNPKAYQKEIEELWKNSKDYDKQTDAKKEALDIEWNKFWNDIASSSSIPNKITELTKTINKLRGVLLTTTIAQLKASHPKSAVKLSELIEQTGLTKQEMQEAAKEGNWTLADLKSQGVGLGSAASILGIDVNNPSKAVLQEAHNLGYSAETVASVFKNATYNQMREAGYDRYSLQKVDKFKKTATDSIKKDYNDFLYNRGNKKKTKDKNWGKIGKDAYLAQVKRGKALGKSEYKVASDLAGTAKLSWTQVLKAAKAAGRKGSTVKKWNQKASKNSNFRKAFEKVYGKWSKFAQGGIANYTGPAWLDGTPSKPELVLNAQDTKNFLTLRDILSKAITSTGSTANTYGDTMYEININVDHINNDYDVDKIANKVKKEIVKTAGYRNVTQARNFR